MQRKWSEVKMVLVNRSPGENVPPTDERENMTAPTCSERFFFFFSLVYDQPVPFGEREFTERK